MWLSLSPHLSVPRNRCNIYLIFIIPSLFLSLCRVYSTPPLCICLCHLLSFQCPIKNPNPHPDALSAVITLLSHQWKSQSIRCSVFSFSPSIHPSLKAWSSISSSHYAQTWHKTNSRSFKQPHIFPVRRAYACVCEKRARRWLSFTLCCNLLFQIAIVINYLSLAGLHWLVGRIDSKWKIRGAGWSEREGEEGWKEIKRESLSVCVRP